MSKPATSVFVFGIYLLAMGIGLILIPNTILNIFGFPGTNEIWIRVVAMLMIILAYYYILAAKAELTSFFYFTIPARIAGIFFFTGFVVLGLASPKLISFGLVDLISAIWTASALRKAKAVQLT